MYPNLVYVNLTVPGKSLCLHNGEPMVGHTSERSWTVHGFLMIGEDLNALTLLLSAGINLSWS